MYPRSNIDRPAAMVLLAILMWGWLVNLLWLGLLLAIPVIVAVFKKAAPKVQEAQLQSLTEFCFVALLVGYFVISNNVDKPTEALILLLKLSPLFFYPVALCRFLGGLQMASLKTLFVPFRYKSLGFYAIGQEKCDLAWLFSFLFLLSASSAESFAKDYYYWCCSIWILLALVTCMPKNRSFVKQLLAIVLSLGIGFGLQLGLHHGEAYLQQQGRDWLTQAGLQDGILVQSTMLGQTAQLQSSEKIILRYKSLLPTPSKLYFRSSVFDQFLGEDTWLSSENLKDIMTTPEGWNVRRQEFEASPFFLEPIDSIPQANAEIWLETSTKNWLPLPDSTQAYRCPIVKKNQRSGEDAIRIFGESKLLKIDLYNEELPPKGLEPKLNTTTLFEKQTLFLEVFLKSHNIQPQLPLKELLDQLHRVFLKFEYSLDLKAPPKGSHPVDYFLNTTQRGHCEFFATATVLLLRACGYSARYCQGFILQEQKGPWKMARGQDAHAWAEVWNGEGWQLVENTPPTLMPHSLMRPVTDLWSEAMFMIDQWRFKDGEDRLLNNAPWLLALVLIYFSYRLAQEWLKHRKSENPRKHKIHQESDPGFLNIENELKKLGFPRYQHETWAMWQLRLKSETSQELLNDAQVKLWNEWHWGEAKRDIDTAKRILKPI
jgi:protein-glutamine gamma-glutamyltransferase